MGMMCVTTFQNSVTLRFLSACNMPCTSLLSLCSNITETLNGTYAASGQRKQMNKLKQMDFTSKFKA